MKAKHACCILALMGMMVSASWGAEVYFSENFDNFDLGTAVTSETPTTNGGSWSIDEACTATVVADPSGSGQKVVKVDTASKVWMRARLDETVSESHVIRFDYYQPAAYGYITMELYSTERTIYTNWLARANPPDQDGVTVFNYNDVGSVISDAYSLPHGTWLTAEYVIPASDAGATEPYTYSFKITDKSTGEVLYEEPAIVSKGKGLPTQYIRFGSQMSSTYYLDNISIVPEPGVLSLLGIGGAMVMRRRK